LAIWLIDWFLNWPGLVLTLDLTVRIVFDTILIMRPCCSAL